MFNEQVKANPGENIGSPHVRIAMKFFMALGKSKDLEPKFLEKLKTWWQKSIQDKDAHEVALAIPFFKPRKPQTQKGGGQKKKKEKAGGNSSASASAAAAATGKEDEEVWDGEEQYAKLQLAMRDQEVMMMVTAELERWGGCLKPGPEPRSFNERDVMKKLKEVMRKRS